MLFIKTFYPRMKSLMEFCLERRNKNGFLEPLEGDWVFIDWANGLPKTGEVSFEQMLLEMLNKSFYAFVDNVDGLWHLWSGVG